MAKQDRSGWFVGGGYKIRLGGYVNPDRQGVRWSPSEDYALYQHLSAGGSIGHACHQHGRRDSAIDMRISEDWYGVSRNATGVLAYLVANGLEKPHLWLASSQAGRPGGQQWIVGTRDRKVKAARGRTWREAMANWYERYGKVTRLWEPVI